MKLWIAFASSGWNTTVRAKTLKEVLTKVQNLHKKYNDGVWPHMKVYEIK